MTDRFAGIPFAALDFYEDLEADNTRTWWLAHKAVYDEQVRGPIDLLAAELEDEFGPATVYRPHRDVRFAADKTPYKTHQGAWFPESHRYLHVSAAGLFVAGGYWRTSPAQVGRLRLAIGDDVTGGRLEAALGDPKLRRLTLGGDLLTRVPAGFDKNHPRSELLRRKTLTLGRDLGFPDWLPTRRTLTEVRRQWRAMAPVIDWLDRHVGED